MGFFFLLALGLLAYLLFKMAIKADDRQAEETARLQAEQDVNARIQRIIERRKSVEQTFAPLVLQHIKTLTRKRLQTVRHDDYNQPIMDTWHKEVDYFINKILYPAIDPADINLIPKEDIFRGIDRATVDYYNLHKDDLFPSESDDLSPIEYEIYCQNILRSCGWSANATKASGDQGVDVIAEKDGVRVVLQCKKYSSPVGNKAVQEIIAGKEFEDAHHGVVVSNAEFTPAAKQLAAKSHIILMHHSELPDLTGRLITLR